ncbi:MAG TPA: hypothetical protein VLL07_03995 [Pontiella sp.]|nr:hypothetical protein [Pontiella sp.]
MKKRFGIMAAVFLALIAPAEMRSWTTRSGETLEGEYVSLLFDQIVLKTPAGNRSKVPLAEVSPADRTYVELANPPELTVDFLESADQVIVKPSPIWVNSSPVTRLEHSFGARIKKTSVKEYPHDLTVEVFAFAQQIYDPSKYRLIFRSTSEPFRLTAEGRYRFEYRDAKSVPLTRYLLSGKYPRGQKMAESLVLVRDERGEIIAYNTTKNWLYTNLEKLMDIPVGGWMDKTCTRRHPTSPRPTWLD